MADIDAKPSVRSRSKRPSLPLAPEVQDELIESGEMELAPEDAMALGQEPDLKRAPTQETLDTEPTSIGGLAARMQVPINRVRTYARERGVDIDRMVRARPWNFVIGAGLIGFILGFRRRR